MKLSSVESSELGCRIRSRIIGGGSIGRRSAFSPRPHYTRKNSQHSFIVVRLAVERRARAVPETDHPRLDWFLHDVERILGLDDTPATVDSSCTHRSRG